MNRDNKQDARVALITGAGRRIGAAIAKHLHQAGFRIFIHCHHSHEEAQALASHLNQQRPESACVHAKDLGAADCSLSMIAAVMQWAGRLDVLVNNASLFAKDDNANWEKMFAINVHVPYQLSHTARPHLERSGGVIINITDIHAERPLKEYSIYCQSKAALAMQTKALASDFAPRIRVNSIAPGAIAWPEHQNALPLKIQQEIIEKSLLKQHGQALYVAQAALALIENPFITGQTLAVDGGRSVR